MASATARESIAEANATKACAVGMCLKYVRGWLDIPPRYPSAIKAWDAAKRKHTDRNPPPGVPVFYRGGKHGHIVLSLGNGKVRSTDAPTRGRVATVSIGWTEARWRYKYLGWTEDLNGVTIPYAAKPAPPAKPKPKVYVKKLRPGVRDSDSVRHLQRKLKLRVDGNYGASTKAAVQKWQRSIGDRGPAADGVMGPRQARRLFGSGYQIIA